MTRRRNLVACTGALAAIVLALWAVPAGAQPLDRDPRSYHILGREQVSLKNYNLLSEGPGCNIGVNDDGGVLGGDSAQFRAADGTQIVADHCAAGGDVSQCFCNTGGTGFDETCEPWATPILADETTATFIEACNLLPGEPFPVACVAGTQNVTIPNNSDCVPASVDSVPGNGRCDLQPGAYGVVNAQKGSSISLDGGVYHIDAYNGATNVTLEVKAASTMNVCGDDILRFGDKGSIIAECGNLRVNYVSAAGSVNVGTSKTGAVTMHVCAPNAEIRLRRGNLLEGNFFARVVVSDANGQGRCCDESCVWVCL